MGIKTGSPRSLAALWISQIVFAGASLDRILESGLAKSGLGVPDRALAKELVYGTVRFYWSLSWRADRQLNKPMAKRDRDLYSLLLIGLYQLIHLRIPAHAAINETVAASKELGKPWAKGLLNAVLRNYLRQSESLDQPPPHHPAATDHPEWLADLLRRDWPAQADRILLANNTRAPMSLRVNLGKNSRPDYLAGLRDQGMEAREGGLSPAAICLQSPCSVTALPGFYAGDVSVQDEAAQIASLLIDLAPGQRVLDACAAPGGKLGHILEIEPDLDEVVALECDAERGKRIQESLDRLGLSAKTLIADAADTSSWWDGQKFQRVLLDVPCSSTGVIRRHPDIKHHRRPGDIKKLVRQQTALLNSLWAVLAPGGKLLYVTCSVLRDENDAQIQNLLNRQSDAQVLILPEQLGEATRFGRQNLPGRQDADGFFYCLLARAA